MLCWLIFKSIWLQCEERTAKGENWKRGDQSEASTTPQQETVWSDPGWEGREGHTGRSSLGCILELTGLPHGLEMEQEAYRETKDGDSKISGVNNQLVALTDMGVAGEQLPKCLHRNLREL